MKEEAYTLKKKKKGETHAFKTEKKEEEIQSF